jgi:hypothetical protein
MKLSNQILSVMTTALVISTVTACGVGQQPNNLSSNPYGSPNPTGPGGLLRNKAVLLTGAAALAYLYRRQHALRASGQNVPRYYLSSNGRVYFRDQSGTAHWVTPPAGGVSIPMSEANRYREFQGFNGNTTGRGLAGLSGSQM